MFVILSFLHYLTGVDGTNKAVEPYGVILGETECLCSVCRVGLVCIRQRFQVHEESSSLLMHKPRQFAEFTNLSANDFGCK